MTIVVDASAVVAALVDDGSVGRWVAGRLGREHLAAPHLLHVEVANLLRRGAIAGDIAPEIATLAHADLVQMPIELAPYRPFAERIWELRGALASYDAWYVSIAETLDVEFLTLDRRLASAPGPRCRFLTPPVGSG